MVKQRHRNKIRLAVYSQTLTMQTAQRFNIDEKIVTKGESLNDDDDVEKVQTIQIGQFHQNRDNNHRYTTCS